MSKLKNYCLNITDGEHGSIIDDPDGEYYFLNNNNITEDGIVINPNDRRMSKKEFERINKRTQLSTNDVVIATCGTLGKTQVITDTSINYDFSRSVGIIKTDPQKLLPLFLHYYFKNPHTQKRIERIAEGAVQKHFYIGAMEDFEVEIPDIGIQKDIISAISKIDGKISNNKSICSDLESMAKLLYDYWFVQFDFPDENGKPYKSSGGKMVWNEELKREIPDGWNLTTIGDITICHDSERVPVASKDRETMKGNIPYYGATGIMGYVNSHIFDGDYVLMAEDGSIMDDKGYPILQRISGKTWVNNHAHVLEPIKGYSCKMLLMMFKDIPVRLIKTGSIQMKINQDNMNAYKLIDIPETIKMKAQAILDRIDEQQLALQQENQELASLRDFLLPMLMNGQVTVKKGETQ